MADRYWVGGAGNWTTANTANWSASSGGAGGASVPTSSDNAFFDANSGTGNVLIASTTVSCANLTFTGFAGTILGSSGFTIAVFGNFTAGSAMTWAHTGSVEMRATSGSYTIDCAGKTLSCSLIIGPSSASTATWTLSSALLLSGSAATLLLRSGTFDSSGFNITANTFSITGSFTKTVNLNSSLVTLAGAGGFSTAGGSGLTLSAGTSTIALSSLSASVNASGFTLYNISFTNTSVGSTTQTLSFVSCNDFSITGPSSSGFKTFNLQNNLTINGGLKTTGTAGNARILLVSSVSGTAQTITINGSSSLTDIDFRDITVNGTSAPVSGTRIGDLKGDAGNSGITFSTPKTVYWNLSGTQGWNANGWAATSGGTPSTDNFPLPQDTAIFDNAGAAGTINITTTSAPYLPTIDCSARTTPAFTLSHANGTHLVYGNIIFSTAVTSSVGTSAVWRFCGRNTQSITSAGKGAPGIELSSVGGTLNLNDAYYCDAVLVGFVVNYGTFNSNGYNMRVIALLSTINSAYDRTINLGASTITADGSTAVSLNSNGSGVFTFNAGTSTINAAGSTITVIGNQQTFYNVTLTTASVTAYAINGNIVFNNLTFPSVSAVVARANITGPITVNGTLTANGGGVKNRLWLCSASLPSTVSISAASVSINNCDFERIVASGTASWSGTSVGDRGGNSGITFTTAKTVYWNLAGSVAWVDNGWATTSGGTPDNANFPLPQDTGIFDNTGSAGTVNFAATNNQLGVPSIDASGRTSAMTLNITTATRAYGNLSVGTGVTFTGTGRFEFVGGNTQTITSNGVTIPIELWISKPTGSVVVADNLNTGAAGTSKLLRHFYGTLNLNGKTITASSYQWDNTAAGTLAFGSGGNLTLNINSGSVVWNATTITNLTITGTPTVNIVTAVSGRTISHGSTSGATESKAVNFNVLEGTSGQTLTITSFSGIGTIDFTGFSGTLNNNTISVYGNVTFSTGMTVGLSSQIWTFASTSGTKTIRTNGKTLFPLTFDGVGGAWQLQDALTVSSSESITLANGTLDLAGFTATTGRFIITTGTKTLLFNGGTLAVSGSGASAFSNSTPTGLTLTNGTGTGTISMTSSVAKTFAGGNFVYPCVVNQGGTGTLTITGNNSFANFTDTVPTANTIQFTGGSTSTFTAFSVSGTAGNLITITSTNTTRANFVKDTPWYMGANSVNAGNNKDLAFSGGGGIDYLSVSYIQGFPPVPGSGKFLMFFI